MKERAISGKVESLIEVLREGWLVLREDNGAQVAQGGIGLDLAVR
jgi:hypothetical protein